MKMTHTPGPWTQNIGPTHPHYQIVCKGERIASVEDHTAQTGSNARLIAAAPDLLEACEKALPWIAKMIADQSHLQAVAPKDCENTMQILQDAITLATR